MRRSYKRMFAGHATMLCMALALVPPLAGAFAALSTEVDDVIADRSAQTPATLGNEISEIRRQIDRLEGAFAERLGRFERIRGYVAQGAVSVVAWLRHRCNLPGRDAVVRASIARSLPLIARAPDLLKRGDIGVGHAAVIAQTVENLGAEQAQAHADTMVDAARRMDCDRFAILVRHLRHAVDSQGELANAQRQHAARYLRIVENDNAVHLDGQLDAEGGALLRAALDPLCRPTPRDQRSAAMRRADALTELARRQLSGGTPLRGVGGVRPHIIVTTTLGTLAGVPGAPAGQLSDGGTLSSETVRRLGCDAAITRLDNGADVAVNSRGYERRTIPPVLRRVLVARDGGCRFPSCDRRPEWTDAHHIIHWADGGKTQLDNVVLLCRTHHRYVHEDGWRIAWSADGSIAVHPP
jgi:hypothetical protein